MRHNILINPILPGFNPDPCICRAGDDYYLAVSSFEWFPGIPIYHSRDLKHWKLLTHCLRNMECADLRRLPSAKGIWAPCLSYDEKEKKFYLMYSVMNSMNARFFDVDNYLMTASDICGPWSEPVYIHSAGFDPSLFHDRDGRKWIVSLEWETRKGYEKPGAICLVEYDVEQKRIIGLPKRIWSGGTDRGCIEGPHLYWRNGYYYILCAEGGTGYGHSVTMGRSRAIWGPYEPDPRNPILTSTPDFNERDNDDSAKPNRYNPDSYLQKSGHGSIVETPLGEVYMVHHCARPFLPELRCTLGRETAIQKMYWTDDGWLRLFGGGNMAQTEAPASQLPAAPFAEEPETDHFDSPVRNPHLYSPRIDPTEFSQVSAADGKLMMRGQESLCSLNRVSLLAHKLTSLQAEAVVKMDFHPERYQHYAGITIYYDNMDYAVLRKTYDERSEREVIDLLAVENGEARELTEYRIAAPKEWLWLKVRVNGRETRFAWSSDGAHFQELGPAFDTSHFSDEYCKSGEFTGAFLGFFCVDALTHEKTAVFDSFTYKTFGQTCSEET